MTISLNRRDFAKGLGGIVLAFTLDPVAAQDPKRLPGSLNGNRMLDAAGLGEAALELVDLRPHRQPAALEHLRDSARLLGTDVGPGEPD